MFPLLDTFFSIGSWLKSGLQRVTPARMRFVWNYLDSSTLGYRLARGVFWSILGSVASRVFALGSSLIAARIMGKTAFGELGIIQSTIGLFGAFAGFGLGMTATKHIAEFRTTDPERAGRILCMSSLMCWITGGVAGLALVLTSPWLATNALAAPQLTGELRVGALYLLLSTINGGQMGALSGFEAFRRIAAVNLWSGLLTFACITVGCLSFGLSGAVWGLVVAQALTCLLAFQGNKQEAKRFQVPLSITGWAKELPLLWRFSLPSVMTTLLGIPVAWLGQSLLARQPSGYEHVADYYSALQLRNIPLTLVGVFVAAILPVYAHARAKDGQQVQQQILRLAQTSIVLTIFPVLIFMGVFAKPILLAYGKGFLTGSLTLQLLLVSVAFEAIANTQVQVMAANGQVWPMFFCYLCGCVAFLVLVFFLVPTMLGHGLALATIGWQAGRWLSSSLYLRMFSGPHQAEKTLPMVLSGPSNG